MKMFITSLLIIAKLKTAHVSNKERIYKQLWYTYVMEHYSARKKKGLWIHVTTWMNLKGIMPTERSKT